MTLIEEEQALARKGARVDAFFGGQAVAPGQGGQEGLAVEGVALHARQQGDHGHVDGARIQQGAEFRRGGLAQAQVQVRVLALQGAGEPGQEVRGDGRNDTEAQGTEEGRLGRASSVLHGAEGRQGRAGRRDHAFARRGHADAVVVAVEDLDAEALLPRGQLGRQGRLGHAAGGGGAAEVAVLGHGHEVAQHGDGGGLGIVDGVDHGTQAGRADARGNRRNGVRLQPHAGPAEPAQGEDRAEDACGQQQGLGARGHQQT